MQIYLTREQQAKHLRKRGLRATVQSLADLARKGRGPRYAIINGRALSTAEWLDAWIDEQVARSATSRKASDEKRAA